MRTSSGTTQPTSLRPPGWPSPSQGTAHHPAHDAAANYKPRQLAAATRAGLDVPRTVITSDPEHAREFMDTDQVIYKSLGGGVLGRGERPLRLRADVTAGEW